MRAYIGVANFLLFFTLVLYPPMASSHPGKTDSRNGHKCWKNCAEWGLERGEYHLHDKNWKPVRLDKNGTPLVNSSPQPPELQASMPYEDTKPQVTIDTIGNGQTDNENKGGVTETDRTSVAPEGNRLPFNLLLIILLIVFLILLLLLIRKKQK